jgi:hypothetical protein
MYKDLIIQTSLTEIAMNTILPSETNPENHEQKQQLIEKVESLFSSVPPDQLRRSITEIYLSYIIQNHTLLPNNFTDIASDLYILLDFLQDMSAGEY